MSNINTSIYSGQYYQLPTSNDSSVAPAGASNSKAATISATAVDNAYLLDLSADAQKYLSSLSNTPNTGDTYMLSKDQQQTLNFILEEYKTVPLTQASYMKLQDDLREAGLSPEQLSAREKIDNFSPTQVFLDALNGRETPIEDASQTQTSEDRKANQYMSKIVQSWQKASTGAYSNAVTG